jgi:RND family efflux transporter MFP subunit
MISAWLVGIFAASVRGGAALLIAWAVCHIRHVPAIVRCWVWRAAYLVLLISFVWTTPVKVPLLHPAIASQPSAGHEANIIPLALQTNTEAQTPQLGAVIRDTEPKSYPFGWKPIAFGLWIIFVAVYGGRIVMNWFKAQLLRRGRQVDAPELLALCRAMKIENPPLVRVHASVRGPLLLGFWRPIIVLPETMFRSRDLRLVFAHEVAHLKRGDLLWNWLPTLATLMLPIHPLVWVCNRQWRFATEAACDADAMAAASINPADYGRILVNIATAPRCSAFGVLAVGVSSQSRWLLKQRLTAMANITCWNPRRLRIAGCVLGGLAVIAMVPWHVVAQEPPATRPTATTLHVHTDTPTGANRLAISVPDGMTVVFDPSQPGITGTPTTVPVAVSAVLSQHFGKANGTIAAATVKLTAGKWGKLTRIFFREGQAVKRGDVIYQLNDATERAKVEYSLAIQDQKVLEWHQKEKLFQKGDASQSEIDEARTSFDLAKSQYALAYAELDQTRVIAPFDGVLDANDLEVGQQVKESEELAVLVHTGQLSVQFYIATNLATELRPGMQVSVKDFSNKDIPASITFIAPATDVGTNAVLVKARVAEDTHNLIAGSHCTITLPKSN